MFPNFVRLPDCERVDKRRRGPPCWTGRGVPVVGSSVNWSDRVTPVVGSSVTPADRLNTREGNLEKSQVFLELLLVERPRSCDEADLFYLPTLTVHSDGQLRSERCVLCLC